MKNKQKQTGWGWMSKLRDMTAQSEFLFWEFFVVVVVFVLVFALVFVFEQLYPKSEVLAQSCEVVAAAGVANPSIKNPVFQARETGRKRPW